MPPSRIYTASEARKHFADVFDDAILLGPVIVRKRNRSVAVVPAEWLEHFSQPESKQPTQSQPKSAPKPHEHTDRKAEAPEPSLAEKLQAAKIAAAKEMRHV